MLSLTRLDPKRNIVLYHNINNRDINNDDNNGDDETEKNTIRVEHDMI